MICGEAVGRLDRDKEVASGSRAEPASDGARVRGRGSPRYEVAVFQYGAFLGAIYGEEEKAQKLGLTGDALREYRQRFIRRTAQDFERSACPAHRRCRP